MARKSKRKRRVKLPLFLVILIVVVAVVGYLLYRQGYLDKWLQKPRIEEVSTEELQIHFMELGNQYTGDSTLIKVGNTEILVDAGSRKESAKTITEYVSRYCTDGILEYVIATHADQDHIAGFVGTSKVKGIFEAFECRTIIDFARTSKDSALYRQYVEKRDATVAANEQTVHYTALQCWNNADGAQRSYELSENVTLNFLYQEFYETDSADENNYSVCFLISQGANHYLFTGDLEAKGEESLVEITICPYASFSKQGIMVQKPRRTRNCLARLSRKSFACAVVAEVRNTRRISKTYSPRKRFAIAY